MPLIATRGAASAQGFGEFSQVTEPVYIESVFSTWLYTGTGSAQTITNNIDLSGKGGLVWGKSRDLVADNVLVDSARGVANTLVTNSTGAQNAIATAAISSFNSNGFSFSGNSDLNASPYIYASWTFRKQPKFFDIVTYTGNGTSGRTVAHNLGSTPGCIIVKRLDLATQWYVYHRSLGATKFLELGAITAETTGSYAWNDTAPTSTNFTVGNGSSVNANGATYVAYLFAHDAGGFGLTGSDNVITCGSFTCDGSGNLGTVTLGYEPQWVLVKRTNNTQNWYIFDTMRGMSLTNQQTLSPNLSDAEITWASSSYLFPTATGFSGSGNFFGVNAQCIYIAIRRGPMKTPEVGTDVYNAITMTSTAPDFVTGFVTDFALRRDINETYDWYASSRLTGTEHLLTNTTSAASSNAGTTWDFNNGYGSYNYGTLSDFYSWNFRRAPGFFDVVCYTGNGPGTQTVNHNLGVVPELVINKTRSSVNGWTVFQGSTTSLTGFLRLNTNNAQGGDTLTVSSTSITADSTIGFGMNTNGTTYVTYLFASVPGVSKVGRYTGTGTTLQVNCGFTNGSRFVLIKRFDSTGDWYVWDSARGIVAGNDPYLLLNSTAAEVTNTDYVDTYSAGFEISSTAPAAINANGGTFIFLAIA